MERGKLYQLFSEKLKSNFIVRFYGFSSLRQGMSEVELIEVVGDAVQNPWYPKGRRLLVATDRLIPHNTCIMESVK